MTEARAHGQGTAPAGGELRVARLLAAGLVAALLAAPGCRTEGAPEGALIWRARCEPESVGVGDLVSVHVEGQWPDSLKGLRLAWGVPGDTLLVVRVDSARVDAGEGREARRYDLALVAPRAGRFVVPPVALVNPAGDTLALTASHGLVASARTDPDGANQLRPLSPLLSLRGFPWWAAALAGALALGAFVAWRFRRRRAGAALAPAGPPPPPPGVEFRDALETLLRQRLAERGEMRTFVQELSWVLRRYLGRRWERPALEATRPEILAWLPKTEMSVAEQQDLSAWLEQTDGVKFAGRVPLLADAREFTERARGFVRRGEEIVAEIERRRAQAALAAAEGGATSGGEQA